MIIIAVSIIFSDSWLESKIESSASKINGAKVEIDNLDLSLFNFSVKWDRLQVTDPDRPMYNLFETGETGFKMQFIPLVRRKVVIDTLKFTGLKTNTKRTASGKLEKPKKTKSLPKAVKKKSKKTTPGKLEKTKLALQAKAGDYKDLRLDAMKQDLNVDSIMLAKELASIDYIDSVKKELETRIDYWEGVVNSDEFERDYAELEEEFKKLSKINPQKLDNIKKLQKAVKQFNSAKKKFDKLTKKLNQYEKEFNADLKKFELAGNEIKTKVKSDYKEIEAVAKIPDIDTKNMAAFIFGESVVKRVNRFIEISKKIAYYKKKLNQLNQKNQKPDRQEGEYIEFSDKYNFPNFWIKHTLFSGDLDSETNISGSIDDIVSNQQLINATTKATIDGKLSQNRSFQVNAKIDMREKNNPDHYDLVYNNLPMRNINFSGTNLFPYKIEKGRAAVDSKLEITGGKFKGNLNLQGEKVIFQKTTSKNTRIIDLIDQTVQNLDNLTLSAKFSNNNFHLNSNIDNIFNKELKNYINKNVAAAKKQLRGEIDKKVKSAEQEFYTFKKNSTADVEKKINTLQREIDKYLEELDNKKSKTEKEIKKKGQKALDDLF